MSRTHAQLTWIDNRPYLQDTGSTHGTWYQPNRVFVADPKGRKIRHVSHAAWEKIPKSLPLQEGMNIRFGRAITNPSNGTRHTPLEVKVRFHRPVQPFKSGTYGLKDSHLNSSDDSSDEDRSIKTRDDTVDCAGLSAISKDRPPEGLSDQRHSSAQSDSKSELTDVGRNINPPDSTVTVGHVARFFAPQEGRKVPEAVDQSLFSNSPSNSTRSSDENPSPVFDTSISPTRPNVNSTGPGPKQSDTCLQQLSSVASHPAKKKESGFFLDVESIDEEKGQRSSKVEEGNRDVDLQSTYGAKGVHSDLEQDHGHVGQEHSSAEEGHSNAEEEHSEVEEEDSGIANDSKDPEGEPASQLNAQQKRQVEPKGPHTHNQNEAVQTDAHEDSEASVESIQVSGNEDSSEDLSSSASCQEISPPKVSSVVDSVQKKHVSKSFKDVSVVTTITSQTQFTESLNRLPESLAKTIQSPKMKRVHKSGGEQETPRNRAALGGNSTSRDPQAPPVAAADELAPAPPVQTKRKRPAEFDEEESGNVTTKTLVSSRKVNKRAPVSVCQHCAHGAHPTKKPKLSSKLVSAAQSIAIFALGGVATVAGILAFENVIE
ncbi:uncharacterized protein PGTG_07061 [Puccinia graminis f. sp. tritici CRL 75-36-700-3]|uniref:FHA domain-containing protein n=1 Tax=Puccinia graminis f. sp. tritici (strain CRL 75-36-700-3 / race SCCL) TaxID=418459 RepID=E3KAN3_PUCGT|nr:uncharacterized protein PGTG_07061 [Puccinia graminis f. sp. tritici CRL 75-36-700-3]EFP81440.2 hypothetical protein PGTG_07061 [Puccinia graminis f. sp. tritici CRL 75-36-700-3]